MKITKIEFDWSPAKEELAFVTYKKAEIGEPYFENKKVVKEIIECLAYADIIFEDGSMIRTRNINKTYYEPEEGK